MVDTLGNKSEMIQAAMDINSAPAEQSVDLVQKKLNELSKTLDSINKKGIRFPKDSQKIIDSLQDINWKDLKSLSTGGASAAIGRAVVSGVKNESMYGSPAAMAAQFNKVAKQSGKLMADDFINQLSSSLAYHSKSGRFGTVKGASRLETMMGMGYDNKTLTNIYSKAFAGAKEQITTQSLLGNISTSEYEKRMTNLNKKYEETIGSVQKLSGEQKNLTKLTERWRSITDGSLIAIQAKLMLNYAALNMVTRSFSYLLNYAVKFDEELHNLQAISGVSNTGLVDLKDTIIDVANASKFTSLELSQTATVLAQAGLSINQIKQTLPAIASLATAAGESLEVATQTVTSALNVFELQGSEAVRVTNALTTAVNESKADIAGFQYVLQYAGKSAADLGITIEELATATGALTQAGIKSKSTLGTGLRAIFVELLNPTKKLQAQLQAVGLTTEDVNVRSRGLTAVLKTLRDSGFGVAEAYAGMERRSASAMTALLSQVDFFENLTQAQKGSTAALIAQETQMEALSNTWKNTQSITGSLVYNGLNPLMKAMQSTLEGINDIAKTSPQLISSIITATTAVGGLTIGVLGLGSAFVGLFSTLSKLKGLGVLGVIGSLKAGPILAVAAAVAALAAGGVYLANKFGLLGDSLDTATYRFEQQKGKVDELKESYNSFSNMMDRAFTQRERLTGENSAEELRLFSREIIERFPQVADAFQKPIESFDELIEKMVSAQTYMTALIEQDMPKLAEEARKVSQEASAAFIKSSGEAKKLTEDIKSFQKQGLLEDFKLDPEIQDLLSGKKKTITSKGVGLLNQILPFGPLTGYMNNSLVSYFEKGTISKEIGEQLDKSLRESLAKDREGTINALRDALVSSETSREMKEYLRRFLNEIAIENQKSNAELNTIIAKGFEAFVKAGGLSQYSSGINSYQAQYKNLNLDTNFNDLDEYLMNAEGLRIMMSNDLDKLNKGLAEGVEKYLNVDSILKEQNIDLKQLRYQIKNQTGEGYKALIKQYTDLIADISEDIEKVAKESDRVTIATFEKRIKNITKNFSSTDINDLDSKVQEAQRLATERTQVLIAKERMKVVDKSLPQALADENIKKLNEALEEEKKTIQSQADSVKNSIDKVSVNTDAFFREFESAMRSIGKNMQLATSQLESAYQYQEGLIAGFGTLFDSSIQADVLQMRLDKTKYNDLEKLLAIREDALGRYTSQREMLINDPRFSNIDARTEKAYQNYLNAVNSGQSADEIKQLNDIYRRLASSQAKYTNNLDNLNNNIQGLENEITNLRGQMAANQTPHPRQMLTGISYGAEKFLLEKERSPFNNITDGYGTITYETLMSMQQGWENFFNTIVDGSFRAGDAFRQLGITMMETMAKVAAQGAAEQFSKLLVQAGFAMFGGTTDATFATESGGFDYAGYDSAFNEGMADAGLFAKGGLVNGPIQNRDSVKAMLTPGEYVLRKNAVDAIGTDFLDNLNAGNAPVIGSANSSVGDVSTSSSKGQSAPLNIWVVTPDQVPQENPSNIIATVSDDIRRNGSIKKLIKQVSTGAL